jgi:hypothetical protein
LCEKCHEKATRVNRKLRKALNLAEGPNRLLALGYLLGFALEDFKVDEVEVDSWEIAKGLADSFSVPVDYLISYLIANDQKAVSFADMRNIFYWALREGRATDRLKPKSEWSEERVSLPGHKCHGRGEDRLGFDCRSLGPYYSPREFLIRAVSS